MNGDPTHELIKQPEPASIDAMVPALFLSFPQFGFAYLGARIKFIILMIIDLLQNAAVYYPLGPQFKKAFEYLTQTDFTKVEKGKYELDGTNLFAIVNEYDTVDPTKEQMESHKKYIDIQYIVSGAEKIGHDLLQQQIPSKAYDAEADYMLFAGKPPFFSTLQQNMFAIFFPHDLHMPNIMIDKPGPVKKVVIKVGV